MKPFTRGVDRILKKPQNKLFSVADMLLLMADNNATQFYFKLIDSYRSRPPFKVR